MHQISDDVLLKNIRKGDEEAFNLLYRKYWKFVYNHAYKRLHSHNKAEDITQGIFCKIWIKRATLHINKDFESYLFIAVRNSVFNLFEKEKRILPVEHLLMKYVAAEHADKLVLQNEFLAAYRALVESLPSKRRKIFVQHYELGKTTAEIAEQLCVSQKTVQNQLGRASTFLKFKFTHFLILVFFFFF